MNKKPVKTTSKPKKEREKIVINASFEDVLKEAAKGVKGKKP